MCRCLSEPTLMCLFCINLYVFSVPKDTTVIDCTTDSSKAFGPVDEGYAGKLDIIFILHHR